MEQIADNFPLNAGVKVAFPSKKVTFTYSEKPTSKKSLYLIWGSIMGIWVLLHIPIAIVVLLSIGVTAFLRFLVFIQSNGLTLPVLEMATFDFLGFLTTALIAISPFVYFFGLPLVPAAYLTWRYEKFSKIFPKWNYFMASLFEPKKRVVVKKLKGSVFELPLFQNVYLGYEASGEFSSLLKNIEVKEFGFKYMQKNAVGKEKEVPISKKWRAIFSFSSVPKSGKLVVNFL